ncbi:alpha/beta-hydrolase [Pterulicium gracile]|uniref:triacylglycerol lipase n=1 Tax=Pterulicium gracile TaxID=1884261 RepID=A0A5C3Q972_9AGAR|nr:alpha/beta-hydrolase [Pterula gracilis]
MLLPTTLTALFFPFLHPLLDHGLEERPQQPLATPSPLQFQLRHLHAVSGSAQVVLSDITAHRGPSIASHRSDYALQSRPVKAYRPSSSKEHAEARRLSIYERQSSNLRWDEWEIPGPDTESRKTLLELAKMTNNAYVVDNNDTQWYELDKRWTDAYPFGWEPDADGFRGHVFATADNSTVVVSVKGTSAGLFGGGGPTAKKDKLNDNLLFSCCCARVDWTWTTACGCYRSGWNCDQQCLEESLVTESLFYPIGTNLYNNITYMYPDSNIWIIGHSLGGALASLLGVTFGVPVVTFESPGERMAASRLHLPSPPSTHHVTHVYHTADPIAMGTCTGVLSSCALGGYAMESRCHLGKSILYDTVSAVGWAVDIRTHGIVQIIDKLLNEPWAPSVEQGREVPEPQTEEDCVECYHWEFGDFPS